MKRTIIIGDVHGCFEELSDLLERTAIGADDLLLSVGDLVDRGPASPRVVEYFRSRPNSMVLMGNHERKHVRNVLSYGQEITQQQFGTAYGEARAWMTSLPYFFEDEHVRVVHAAMVPGVPLSEQGEHILCGSTSGERELERLLSGRHWHELYADAKPIVSGHHVVGKRPFVRDDVVFGIDTGACHGGTLTALTVPDFKLYSVPAREDHWARVKHTWQMPVLRAKPWASMPWHEIDERLAPLSSTRNPELATYVRALQNWCAALRGMHAVLLRAVETEAERIRAAHGDQGFAEAARAHRASALLFQQRAGRLDLGTIQSRGGTPERVLQLAADLGVTPTTSMP